MLSSIRVTGMLAILAWVVIPALARGADASPESAASGTIAASIDASADTRIKQRIDFIYAQIDGLENIDVSVNEGVVTLTGTVANETLAQRALSLAFRLEGVVTVEDEIERSLDLRGNLAPQVKQLTATLNLWWRAAPLFLLAALVFAIMTFSGYRLAMWKSLWTRVAPNAFLADLISQAIRVAAVVLGLILALNLLDANSLIGTILGGAGVLGLAIGFAVRDTLENYISSIMLSLRQPFRAGERVAINEFEGIVIRLTSRATVLMTVDGNHLRIPNSTVYKAVILNYSRNPERRFTFQLGIDAEDDPLTAMGAGTEAMRTLDFILAEPDPEALIKNVGDSSIIIEFNAWIDQSVTDFLKARSVAIHTTKRALESAGFTLPEPIYRLRLDDSFATGSVEDRLLESVAAAKDEKRDRESRLPESPDTAIDVNRETHLDDRINEERARESGEDLLDVRRPVE